MNDTPSPVSSPAPEQPRTGLSVTSLVLGILSFLGCTILTGIPAIITGHIAHSRAKKQPHLYGGAGMALGGLILGYVGSVLIFAVAILAGLLLPALAKAKQRAQSVQCTSNMKQIGLAVRMWSADNNGRLPADFLSLSNQLMNPAILVCPGDKGKEHAESFSDIDPLSNVTYEFLAGGAKESEVESMPIMSCPVHGHTGMGDGSVQARRR